MWEYCNGRYVNVSKVMSTGIYQKDGKIRVAIELDVTRAEKSTVYSDEFQSIEAAKEYCKTMPVLVGK